MARKPVPKLSGIEKMHAFSQFGVPAFYQWWVADEVELITDLHWRIVFWILYVAGVVAAGVPVFGSFTRGDDDAWWPASLVAAWERLLRLHALIVWLLGAAATGSVWLFRAERISFDTMASSWGALLVIGVFAAVALRWTFKRRLRAAQQQPRQAQGLS